MTAYFRPSDYNDYFGVRDYLPTATTTTAASKSSSNSNMYSNVLNFVPDAAEDEETAGPELPGKNVLCLYPEILSHIFQFLDIGEKGRVAQVCRYWKDVVYEKVNWRRVEAKIHLRKTGNAQVFQGLSKRGITAVQILSLKRSLRELVAGLPEIVSLRLSGCYCVTDSTLASAFIMTESISTRLTCLTSLDLSLCKQVTDVSLARIANRAPNLVSLELGGCCQISDCGLLLIAWGLKNLQRLNLRSCYLITDTGIGFLTGAVSPSHLEEPRIRDFLRNLGLFSNSTDLKSTDLPPSSSPILELGKYRTKSSRPAPPSDPRRQHKKQRLDEILFVQTHTRVPKQKCAICQQQTGYPFQAHLPGSAADGSGILSSNTRVKLHGRRRSGYYMLTNAGATQRPTQPHLKEYFLEKIGPTSSFGVKNLLYLGLQDCQKLSDRCLTLIGSGGLPALQSINLSFCIHISDGGLRELSHLTSLTDVNLRSCDNVTDAGLLNLSDGGARLRSLDVSFCDKVGDAGLGYVAQFMTRLRVLCLSACEITDKGLARAVTALSELETLNLGQCNKITDEAVKVIAEKCKRIKYMDLYGCTQISKEGLDFILKIQSLKTLNLGLWHCR